MASFSIPAAILRKFVAPSCVAIPLSEWAKKKHLRGIAGETGSAQALQVLWILRQKSGNYYGHNFLVAAGELS